VVDSFRIWWRGYQILPLIDGVNYVKKIALYADMDVEVVKKALQHLVYYGCVVMVADIFQMTNQYTTTKEIVRLYHDVDIQRACLNAIRLPPSPTFSAPSSRLTIGKVLRWYSALRPGYALSAFVRDYGSELSAHRINVHTFITFGLVNRLIRRLHKYPLTLNTTYQFTPNSGSNTSVLGVDTHSASLTSPTTTTTAPFPHRAPPLIPNIQQYATTHTQEEMKRAPSKHHTHTHTLNTH
jgi:hypothetical protein